MRRTDVAVVGGGPAGAVVAALLARAGHDVALVERSPEPRWHACGVFASPAAMDALRAAGVAESALATVARAIPAMRVETPGGARFRLTYGDDGSLRAPAVGFARPALDGMLLAFAAAAGAAVLGGTSVGAIDAADGWRLRTRDLAGDRTLDARIVVGADGIRSGVARRFGVVRRPRLGERVGLTFHVTDPRPTEPRDARMVVFRDGYVGLAPVPDGRVNVGIVLGRSWRAALAERGADGVSRQVLASIPDAADDPMDWPAATPLDRIAGAAPIEHRVSRAAGDGWLLVGDAAGFLDPFTGEGLHRALVSAGLAAAAIESSLAGDARALDSYARRLRGRFVAKDLVTLVVQGFLGWPVGFEYAARRLAARARVRETMGRVMGDLVPARRALDPRFLAAILRP